MGVLKRFFGSDGVGTLFDPVFVRRGDRMDARLVRMVSLMMICLSGCALEVGITDSGVETVRISVETRPVFDVLPGTATVGTQPGMKAPDFLATDLGGGSFALHEVAGKAAVICFWSLYSAASQRELVHLNTLHQILGDDLTIVGVNVVDSAAQVRAFVEQNGYVWPFVLDSQGMGRSRFSVRALPTTAFLDKRRIVTALVREEVGLDELSQLAHHAVGR